MTERIRELAEQAGMLYDGLDRPIWAAMDKVDMDNFLKDFYQVIVKQCADIADKAEPYKSGDLILKYFGINYASNS